ncbi:hypothetical protein CYMTET_7216 [Cymbomonas tetramitiformis]|uniref:Uncharacterized protein n=1 Tax=Cymbomonas tetramitiformis TaxID=36881 RepID=A0AAE0GVF6_9CHLO|nr:hypothetical protein CYMTET_7216 [Cymbomonas tetramitiformis]
MGLRCHMFAVDAIEGPVDIKHNGDDGRGGNDPAFVLTTPENASNARCIYPRRRVVFYLTNSSEIKQASPLRLAFEYRHNLFAPDKKARNSHNDPLDMLRCTDIYWLRDSSTRDGGRSNISIRQVDVLLAISTDDIENGVKKVEEKLAAKIKDYALFSDTNSGAKFIENMIYTGNSEASFTKSVPPVAIPPVRNSTLIDRHMSFVQIYDPPEMDSLFCPSTTFDQ